MLTYESKQPWVRKVWIGREHPEDITDYVPFWMGHSVGRWDADTLVIDTLRIKDGTLLSARQAIPKSGYMHMVERFQLLENGQLSIELTYDDPVTFTQPWSETRMIARRTDYDEMAFRWEIEENHDVCEATGGYWAEHDPWFDNFETIAEEIIVDRETLDAGLPPLPEGPIPEPYLGPFGQPR